MKRGANATLFRCTNAVADALFVVYNSPVMKKRIAFTALGVILVAGTLAAIKALQFRKMMAQAAGFVPPPEPVITSDVERQTWESLLDSVGTIKAVQGVTVSAEMAGKVLRIPFAPGKTVRAATLLVQQDVSTERAQLRAAEARLALARATLDRVRQLLVKHAAAEAELDNATASVDQAEAEVDNIRTVIDKKTIRAPFSGRLGIRLVNLGQVLNPGTPIVELQSVDPVFVNFRLPQNQLARLKVGLPVRVSSNAIEGPPVTGTITAINPVVDSTTRNVEVQATLPNKAGVLKPGMFVEVIVVLPDSKDVLAMPATAVLYAPYSDSVFVVEQGEASASPARADKAPTDKARSTESPAGDAKAGAKAPTAQAAAQKIVRQQTVRLGERRGDYVAVLKGLKAGDVVVSSGVFKLRNGQAVVVDNRLRPEFKLEPTPQNE